MQRTSTQDVEENIQKFLVKTEPEILCLHGNWGIGKSYTLSTILKNSQPNNQFGLKHISIVSLFGLNSLEALKEKIFLNIIPVKQENLRPNQWSVSNTLRHATRLSEKVKYVEGAGNIVREAIHGISLNGVIIILDDIERKGKNLSIKEIFGLCDYLRNEKDCKIILIVNKDTLGEDLQDFERLSEKTIDVNLKFEPTTSENADIAIPSHDKNSRLIKENFFKLKIKNIRVMKKIQTARLKIEKLLEKSHENTSIAIYKSLVLMGYIHYEDKKELLKYYKNNFDRGMLSKNQNNDPNPELEHLLRFYAPNDFSDLESLILDGFESGSFDRNEIQKEIQKLDDAHTKGSIAYNLSEAWDSFFESLDEVTDENVEKIFNANEQAVKSGNISHLSRAVTFFREINDNHRASKLIKIYIDAPLEASYYDLGRAYSSRHFIDTELAEAAAKKLKTFPNAKSFLKTLIDVNKGWSPEDISFLNNQSDDEYLKLFEQTKGIELRHIVSGAMGFRHMDGASAQMLEISDKALLALKKIAARSPRHLVKVRSLIGYEVKI